MRVNLNAGLQFEVEKLEQKLEDTSAPDEIKYLKSKLKEITEDVEANADQISKGASL